MPIPKFTRANNDDEAIRLLRAIYQNTLRKKGIVSVSDISQGTQTNDVKVTLDSEEVVLGAGTNAVGKLAANSGVDIGDVDVTSLPDVVLSGVSLPTSVIATNGASALTIISASASNKHRIFNLTISVDTNGTVTISDGLGAVYMAANTSIVLNFGVVGKLQDTANTAITITNSGGGNVSAHGTYSTEAA